MHFKTFLTHLLRSARACALRAGGAEVHKPCHLGYGTSSRHGWQNDRAGTIDLGGGCRLETGVPARVVGQRSLA
jgi:hypothetical protein